jgi:general secretion pathway protein D
MAPCRLLAWMLAASLCLSASSAKTGQQLRKISMLADKGRFDEAERVLDALERRDPAGAQVVVIRELIRQKRAASLIKQGDHSLAQGDREIAQKRFAQAYILDPQNEYARARFADASDRSARTIQSVSLADEPQLKPKTGLHDLEYRGDSRGLIDAFAREFGLHAEYDPSFSSRATRFSLKQVNFPTALQAVNRISKSFFIPLSENQFLVANDDAESRRRLERMSLRTFVLPDVSGAQDLIELVNVLRMMFDLRQIMPNQATASVTVRAPGAALDAAQRLLEDISAGRPEVLIDVQVLQVSRTRNSTIGTSLPLQFTAFNINTELRNFVTDPNIQSLLDELAAGGELTPEQAAALAAFLAAQQNAASPLLQGFATFGGGATRTGVVIPPVTLNLKTNESDVKLYQHITMRAQHAKAATYRIGDRYPVLTGTFSPLVDIPVPPSLQQQNNVQPLTPSFNYEDLGITFKATPNIGTGKDIRIDFDLALRSLTGQSFNGVPAIANRQYVGSMGLRDGDTTVIAGSVNFNEQKSLQGLPFLSLVPGLKEAVSTTIRQKQEDQLLLLVTAHLVRSGHVANSQEIVLAPSSSAQ